MFYFYLILWLLSALASALVSFEIGRKKEKAFSSFLLGFLLGPLGIFVTFFRTDKDRRKNCPYCKELVHHDAVVCPHCRKELTIEKKPETAISRWVSRYKVPVIIFSVIGFLVVMGRLFSGIDTTPPPDQPLHFEHPTTSPSPAPSTAPSQQSEEPISYTRIPLSEIANKPNAFPAEIRGVIIIGTGGASDSTYIHIQDGQAHAILSISSNTDRGKKILSVVNTANIGDTISVKVFTVVMNPPFCGFKNQSDYEVLATLCKFLGLPPNAPYVLAIEDFKIINKSGSTIKALQSIPPPQID